VDGAVRELGLRYKGFAMPTASSLRRNLGGLLSIATLLSLSGGAMGMGEPTAQPPKGKGVPEVRTTETAEEMERAALSAKEMATRKFVLRRDLQVVRNRHFTGVRSEAVRAAGMERLRQMAGDPVALPIMLDVFAGEPDGVRVRVLEMLADLKTDASDATVAWVAMTAENLTLKKGAMSAVERRSWQLKGDVPMGVQSVIAAGLESSDNARAATAANMALGLRLYEAIPSMIAAQVRPSNAGEPGAGAIAQIVIGTQRAFISDLTPVVGQGAVAFDPQVSTVTDGVVLRVFDAYVITYRTEVHSALVALSQQLAPDSKVATIGYDQEKWAQWYASEGEKAIAAKRVAITAQAASGAIAPAAGGNGAGDAGAAAPGMNRPTGPTAPAVPAPAAPTSSPKTEVPRAVPPARTIA